MYQDISHPQFGQGEKKYFYKLNINVDWIYEKVTAKGLDYEKLMFLSQEKSFKRSSFRTESIGRGNKFIFQDK